MDVIVGQEWIARVEMARQAVEIIGQRLNGMDRNLKALEDYSLEEVESVRKELEHASKPSTRQRRPLLP